MHRLRPLLPALVTLAAVLGFVGVSAALEGDPISTDAPTVTCPEADATAPSAVEGDEVPGDVEVDEPESDAPEVDGDAADACDDEVEAVDPEPEVDEPEADSTEAPEADAPAGEHPDNHGAAVSTAAHECPPGPEHGPCVREVAHSDAGKDRTGDDVEGDEAERPDADEGAAGSDHGNGKAELHGHAADHGGEDGAPTTDG